LRAAILRAVEEIKGLCAKLQPESLREADGFCHCRVHLPQAGSANQIAAGIAERARGRHREGRWIDPLLRRLAALGVRETPGTRLGRSEPDTLYKSGRAELERLTTTFTGRPVRAVAMVLSCQPPSKARAAPGCERCDFPAPNGNS